MNYSYNPLHLSNTYGAFGSVTKQRYEIVIEGTDEPVITAQTKWQEYEFRAKPGYPRLLSAANCALSPAPGLALMVPSLPCRKYRKWNPGTGVRALVF